jgi:glycosyltransferase involved in cell wall biosynthesis
LIAPADFEQQVNDSLSVMGLPRPSSRLQRPLVWWRLYRRTRLLWPDVIHVHDPELLLLVPLFRLTLGRRVRIVYDVHEYFVDSLAEKYWIPRWLRPIAVSTARRLEKLLVRGVDGIICAVEGQKHLYDDYSCPIAVVRNFPLATLFEDAEPHSALDVEGFKLIYVGLILPERGISILLEAMHLLRRQGVEDVYLFLIGPDTSSAYIQEIQAFARTRELSEQVRWLGYVEHAEIKHYLVNAQVGLVPGLRTDLFRKPGISTKLLEYMLCGLPIISVDHPHHQVFVDEGSCGLLVSPTDATAHAEAIMWMRNHPDKARAMGLRGREMVLDHYTWEREQQHLLEFYDGILS